MPTDKKPRKAKGDAPSRRTRVESRLNHPRTPSFHADGMWGGITPRGHVVMGFFTEKFAPPEKVTYELPDTIPGQLTEVNRQGGGFIQRDIVAEVFVTLDVAKSMVLWLEDKITMLEAGPKALDEASDDTTEIGTGLYLNEGKSDA